MAALKHVGLGTSIADLVCGTRAHAGGAEIDITMIDRDDVMMRTTLSLDPDVAERVQQEMKRSGSGLKKVINDALRLGLGLAGKRRRPPRFVVESHSFGFRPGFDLDRLNQLADELEAAEQARALRR